MATPRVFLSSTCYDLIEIRHNLRNFIQEFNYEPVMSDFGDVFYEYESHVQDACVKEIDKCQMYILVIGNNYGTIYHKSQTNKEAVADSVTLKEFRNSILINIPKHIFINKFVQYDYQNYRRVLDRKLKEYFDVNEIDDKDVDASKQRIRKDFDSTYPFPQAAYKYIFHFLDVIYGLKVNNAIFPFETVEDIKAALKKQWAGYMYEKLTDSRLEKIEQAQKERLDDITLKITRIEKMLNNLFSEAQTNHDKVSFNIGKYINSVSYENFTEIKELLDDVLSKIMECDYEEDYPRCRFAKELTCEQVLQWLVSLDNLLKKFKWSKTIPITEIFSGFSLINIYEPDISFENLTKLYGLFSNMPSDEMESFANSVKLYLDKFVSLPRDFDDEEIPF